MSGIFLPMNKYVHLTGLQRQILGIFRERCQAGLAPPTYRELCREFGWRSTGTARDHLKALIRKGVLDPGSGRARGTHIRNERLVGAVTLPLVGRIVAGQPVVSYEVVDEEIAVPSFLAPTGDGFLLRVSGDSMEGAGILDGDIVVVHETGEPRPGEIVAATISGETTLKRLERHGQAWILAPENPMYKAIEINTENIKIHGVVIAVLRALHGSRSSMGRHHPDITGKSN